MRFYFLFSQSWIPPLSKCYRHLQSLHALHPHYHITDVQQQRTDFTHGASVVLQLFREAIWATHANEICSDSTPSSGNRPYRFSISLSRPLQLLAPQQIARFGRLHSDTFNSIRKGKKKKNQKTSFTIPVAYATTDMRSSEEQAETFIGKLIPPPLGWNKEARMLLLKGFPGCL